MNIGQPRTASFPAAWAVNTGGSTGTGPRVFLNYMTFDKNYVPVTDVSQTNYVRISTAAKETGTDIPHQKLTATVTVKQAGYMYIYFSNEESTTNYEAFFDDFTVTHSKSPVLQAEDYYPFGLTCNSYQRENSLNNRYLFNGKERQTETGWDDFGGRMYMSDIGRFTTVDPLADSAVSWNPYHYVRNNPLNRIDPTGLTDYELNESGKVVNVKENEEADNIFMVDQDGARIEGKSISFEYGAITAVRNPTVNQKTKSGEVKETNLTIFEVNGDKNATQMFEFLADPSNTNVEWTHASIGTETSDKNIVGTSHQESSTGVGHYLRTSNYTLKEVYHNHPGGISRPSAGDRSGAALYHRANINTILGIYTHPGNYMMYNQNGAIGVLKK
jgi:RHS repeat-associated protein